MTAPYCPVCGELLREGEIFVCTQCRYEAPLTNFWLNDNNPMVQRFWGLVPIRRASAFLWFIDQSRWRHLIHLFKYKGHWPIAERLGKWYGHELCHANALEGVDVIVPVPLHWVKRMKRSYNQSESVATGISRAARIPRDFGAVKRVRNNPSQALKGRNERWDNVAGIFKVTHPERLRGRHILLVDDVFTTGATVISCAEAIFAACDGDVEISVAALAISHRMFGND